jgi:hypothetical protein
VSVRTIATLVLALVSFAAATPQATSIPFPEDLFKDGQRRSVKEVVEDFTVHRQIGGLRLLGSEAVLGYLVMHPEFTASLARAAGVLRYTVRREGPTEIWADDHRGLTGRIELLQATQGQLVYYAQGTYKKGFIRIPGRVALVARYVEGREGDAFYVENTVSAFVRVDAPVLDPLARLFRPIVERIMNKRVAWFFGKANQLMTKLTQDPEAVLQKLPPDTWQEEAAQLRMLLKAAQADIANRRQAEAR